MNDRSVLLPYVIPIFKDLVLILLRKCEYPRDMELCAEDKETFRWYRTDIADTLVYCCNVLHDTVLEILLSQLQLAMTSPENAWQPLESCLFAFAAIAENTDENESQYLPPFFAVLPTLPFDSLHLYVACTAMELVGSYSNWLNYHPELLTHVIPLLLMGLNNSETAPSATLSLKDISKECQLKLKPYSDLILHTSRTVLNEGKIKQAECIRLMYSIGNVLSVLPLETILHHLDTLILPIINQIKTLLEQDPTVAVRSDLLLRLRMIGMLFSSLDVQACKLHNEEGGRQETETGEKTGDVESPLQPVFLVMEHVIGPLSVVVDKWANDLDIVPAVFTLLKNGLITLLQDCMPFVPAMVDIILSSYKKVPTTAALEFAKPVSINACLLVIQPCKRHKCFDGIQELDRIDILQPMKILLLPELITVKAAVFFFTAVISHSRDHNLLLACVQQYGEKLVETLLACIGGAASRVNIEPLSDILLELNKKHSDNMSRWLTAHLSRADFPSHRPSLQVKAHFAKTVVKHKNRHKLQETVRDFSLVCRGLVNTEYAASHSETTE
ncbi:importin-13-like [Nilaparvata lugens]|uniref:importin-13-like n=1 Tax=Nilaparvata lugens TaxID=108931 RepID=UPI00193D3BA9|nr:importin-13-like [Nilaparvata lugens]